jgi:hypothetical protein
MNLIFYTTTSGQINRVAGCSPVSLEANKLLVLPGEAVMEAPDAPPDDLNAHYVLAGELAPRPVMGLSVSQNPFTVTGIPVGTEVTYPGGTIVVDDGFIEWDSEEPGNYRFWFQNFPYQEEEIYAEIG